MNALPKVSVVIPFYNCPFIQMSVYSALTQTYPNIEVIVVDDGSVRHADKLAPYFNRIMYIRKENGGTASALNQGIAAATGEYFAWLSSDDVFHPHKIARQIAGMQRTGAPFSHTAFRYIDVAGQVLSVIHAPPYPVKRELIAALMEGCHVNGSSVVMRMSIFQQTGRFDESLLYTQDYDMWLRTVQHFEWLYLDEPLLDYRVHDNMGTRLHGEEQALEISLVKERHRLGMERMLLKEGSD